MSLKRKIISESINWEAVLKMPFVDAIKKAAGQVYVVGGSVRDHYLGKDSKDVDLLVRNLPLDQIEDILKKFGRVDIVGKSFGVIKFVPNDVDLDEPIDIAVPRTERPTFHYVVKKGQNTIFKIKYGGEEKKYGG